VNLPYSQILLCNCIFLKLATYFTVSATDLVTPNVYRFAELMVGNEFRKKGPIL